MFMQAKISATGLVIWLGMTVAVLAPVLVPSLAQAYTARVNVAIDRQNDESYEALVQRAELVARAAAQRSFDRDILINDVSIMIIAQSQGVEVPILTVDVSRQQWRSRPDPRRWATYYKTAKTLLRLDGVATPGSFPSPPAAQVPLRAAPIPVAPIPVAPKPQSPLPPGQLPSAAPGRTSGGATIPNRTNNPNNQPTNAPGTAPLKNPNVPTADQEEEDL